MLTPDAVDLLMWVTLWSVTAGAGGGVLVASLIRWFAELAYESGERASRIAQARRRDHRAAAAWLASAEVRQ